MDYIVHGIAESDTTEQLSLPLSQVVLVIKNLPANAGDIRNREVPSLGGEDPLVEGMATHSSILTWTIPWTEEPSGLQSMGLQRVRQD